MKVPERESESILLQIAERMNISVKESRGDITNFGEKVDAIVVLNHNAAINILNFGTSM